MFRIASRAIVLAAFLLAPSTVNAQTASDGQMVVTSGEGIVTRAPDRAWVSIRAESRSKDPKEAQRTNAAAMDAVMAKLKTMNLGADAVRTVGYELHPEFDYANGRQTLRGYVAVNSIDVRVDDIARVGEVLGVSVGSGATSVGGLRFDLKDRDSAEREALRLAVRDARARAEAAADGAGMRIGAIVRIEESRMPIVRPMQQMHMRDMAGVASADAAPPITAGTIEIRAMVTLTASIR